jgi:cytidylate kinase
MAIITISRGTFSGGLILAEKLAEKLGYRCVGREEIVETAARKYGVSEEKLLKAMLKGPSPLRRFTYEREEYLAYVQAVLCEDAKNDNMVYHGNAGHFLLKGVPHVLRVRIVAPMAQRIKFVVERQQLLPDEAVKYIEKIDKQRINWTKFLYGVDWRSPELYDIVFNLENENISFIVSMIEHAVQQEPFKATPEAQRAMDNLTLSSLIRAAIASNPQTRDASITIAADGDKVRIQGKAKTQEVVDTITRMAFTVLGVKEVDNTVRLDYRYQDVQA